MCRLLAYSGPPRSLDTLLREPEHSLITQSYQPREMSRGLINADGFGLGWYSPHLPEPGLYASTLPIWNDTNLPHLERHLISPLVFASVRSATIGLPVEITNCQPYAYRHLMGMHNGFIQNFRLTLMRPLRQILTDEAYRSIQGTTDSEHIFALWLDYFAHLPQTLAGMALALEQTVIQILDMAQGIEVSLNLVMTNGQSIVACRCANRPDPPTLYLNCRHPAFPHAALLASEPFDDHPTWQAIAPDTLVMITSGSQNPNPHSFDPQSTDFQAHYITQIPLSLADQRV